MNGKRNEGGVTTDTHDLLDASESFDTPDALLDGDSTAPSALIVGPLFEQEREQIARAAARAGVALHSCPTISSALARLRKGQGTLAALVTPQIELSRFVDAVRDHGDLFTVPIVAYVQRPSADGFRDAYRAGADDVLIASDPGGLTRRLANLGQSSNDSRPSVTQGLAVVASSHEGARRRLGRTLRQVGFDVAFAANIEEVGKRAAGGEAPMLAVTTSDIPPAETVEISSTGHVARVGDVPVLFLGLDERNGLRHTGEQIVDATSRLLFFADERTKARFKDRRASARKLYAGVCSFREAGSVLPTFAVTYNVSREGIYVRTLDPPRPDSQLWVELLAPTNGTPVHVRARVVWQRLPSGKGILPPGCGLRIDPNQCPPGDLDDYLRGYEALEG